MTDAHRTELLAQAVTIEVSRGAHVESQTAFGAVVAFRPQCTHVLHFVLCLLTCWLWGLVWITQAGKPEERFLLVVSLRRCKRSRT